MSAEGPPRKRRLLVRGCLVVFLLGVVGLSALILHERDPLPEGEVGVEAEALTRRIERSVDVEAWKRTGAVRWTFAGRNHHLWDRKRNLARVSWGDVRVLVDLSAKTGRAWRGDVELEGAERDDLVSAAWSHWANDSFWLNPLAKLRDSGVERSLVTLDDRQALLITYQSGGDTPGDSYLWIPDADGRPERWRMWVSKLPIGGVDATWEEWITLSTGARVATLHRVLGFPLVKLTDVQGAATLAELESGDDPFAPIH